MQLLSQRSIAASNAVLDCSFCCSASAAVLSCSFCRSGRLLVELPGGGWASRGAVSPVPSGERRRRRRPSHERAASVRSAFERSAVLVRPSLGDARRGLCATRSPRSLQDPRRSCCSQHKSEWSKIQVMIETQVTVCARALLSAELRAGIAAGGRGILRKKAAPRLRVAPLGPPAGNPHRPQPRRPAAALARCLCPSADPAGRGPRAEVPPAVAAKVPRPEPPSPPPGGTVTPQLSADSQRHRAQAGDHPPCAIRVGWSPIPLQVRAPSRLVRGRIGLR